MANKSKYSSIFSFFISFLIMIFGMVFFGNEPTQTGFISLYDISFSVFVIGLCYGLFLGIKEVRISKKFEIFSSIGIFLNGIWLLILISAYLLKW